MKRQIKWGIQNGSITKYGVLPVATFLFQFYNLTAKTWFDVPPTQMSIFILFEIAEVLFEVAFLNKSIEILRCASDG